MPTCVVETLARYVPAMVVRRFALAPTPLTSAVLERFPAAVLFADISGFTSLAERLAQLGPAGVEELTKHLNNYFGKLIASIATHGGDVVKFAGDAILAVWPAIDEPLEEATLRAAQSALTILSEVGEYVADDIKLTLHVGIAAGETIGLHVGGVKGRWEFLIAGSPLEQMARAEAAAKSGEVCISQEGWGLIQDKCQGTVLESGVVRLEAVRNSYPPRILEMPALVPEMLAALRGYIAPGILARLDAGQTEWLAELRRVTVLFVKLEELNYTATDFLERVQQAMVAMQKALYQYEGTIRQFIMDDKGSVLIAAFGLPPFTHEDDAERAARAALAMQESLWQLGLPCAIGITRSRVYCGSVGSSTRCEYAMVGDGVNLAARLMVAAGDEVWCDDRTFEAARRRLRFECLPAIKVKGKAEPIVPYRPIDEVSPCVRLRMPVVGRTEEKQLLAEKLHELGQARVGGVVAIEGEAGIGKSRLVEEIVEMAFSCGVKAIEGGGDAINKSTPYYAWRKVFSQLFDLDEIGDRQSGGFSYDVARKRVLAHLASEPQWQGKAALLNAVLPLNFPENELTRQLSGKVRAENIRNLLVHLLQLETKASPTLLILEDLHWMDSASLSLTLLVAEQVESLLLVMATRPLAHTAAEYRGLLQMPRTLFLKLEALSAEDTVAIAAQRIGVARLPDPVTHLIRHKAQGNPFFSEELIYALRDAGLIAIADGDCQLTTNAQEFSTFACPDTVEASISSRIDKLTPMQGLTLKVASVIGRAFAFRVLRDIHPIEADKAQIAEFLYTFEKLDLTRLEAKEPDLRHIFKHVITWEVAYNLMLFEQRRQLHAAVALWYERNACDLPSFYPTLAYHWSRAVESGKGWSLALSKAIDYLEKAGEQAVRSYSLQEAASFFKEILAFCAAESSAGARIPVQRQARWHRHLGEAYLGLGMLPESREYLGRSLLLLGRPMPATGAMLAASLLKQVLEQLLHRLGFVRFEGNDPQANEGFLETARVYELFSEIYYHANETLAAIYCAIRTLNLAERAQPSAELARAYAVTCFAAGVIPWHALAEKYSHLGRETAQRVDSGGETEARALIITSAYYLGVGQWEKTRQSIDKAMEICVKLGDRYQWGQCLTILAKSAYFQGNFALGASLWAEVYAAAKSRGDILQQAWGLNGQAEGILRQGNVEEAARLLEESLRLFAQNRDRVSETATYGMLAVAHLRSGELQLACKAAEETQKRLKQISSPNSYYLIEAYAGVAEVYLTLWEIRGKSWEKLATKACKALHQFAFVFPIGQARAWLWQGVRDCLAGHDARARISWRKSLAAAEKLGMPYEGGLAHEQMRSHRLS